MATVRNVVFDFGQVLIRYIPDEIARAIAGDRDDLPLLIEALFTDLWLALDAGKVTNEEATRIACERLPAHLHEAAAAIYREWIHHIPPVEGMWELVRELKEDFRVPLFLLSNISVYFTEHTDLFPVLSHFDKCIFSGPCRMIKPNREIYEHLLDECGIKAEETLFIDDNPANIAGAEAVGIRGYLFDGDAARLRAYLAAVLPPKGEAK